MRFTIFAILMILFSGIVSSCGIEEYVYLEPITSSSAMTTDSLRIKVFTPEQSSYFEKYVLFYKIYPNSTATEPTMISTDSTAISTTNDDSPSSIETVLTNRGFKQLSFGDDSQTKNVNFLSDTPLTSQAASSFEIEFNLDSTSHATKYPYLLDNSGTSYYRLLRAKSLNFTSSYFHDLTYEAFLLSYPSVSSSGPADIYKDTSLSSLSYAYVMIVGLAYGHDSSYSEIYSTALKLGVFKLSETSLY